MNKQIHVALLDEGVNVWRPAPAWQITADTFIILRPDAFAPDMERWEFQPGSTVVFRVRTQANVWRDDAGGGSKCAFPAADRLSVNHAHAAWSSFRKSSKLHDGPFRMLSI